MNMAKSVLSLSFSRKSDYLTAGSLDGSIKVWNVGTGKCIRAFSRAHVDGITCTLFSRDNGQILSASYDKTIKIHGVNSGKCLKEFTGHTSYVLCAAYVNDEKSIISSSTDTSVRVWNVKTMECVFSFQPTKQRPTPVRILIPMRESDDIIVGNASNVLYIMKISGEVARKLVIGNDPDLKILSISTSPKERYIYCLLSNGEMCPICVENWSLEERTVVVGEGDGEILGSCHHPSENLLALFTLHGSVCFYANEARQYS